MGHCDRIERILHDLGKNHKFELVQKVPKSDMSQQFPKKQWYSTFMK